jgi:hypothetical protein
MAATQDAMDEEEGEGGAAAGGGEDGTAADEEADRRDRDARLSRASEPRVAGPRLRSS